MGGMWKQRIQNVNATGEAPELYITALVGSASISIEGAKLSQQWRQDTERLERIDLAVHCSVETLPLLHITCREQHIPRLHLPRPQSRGG